VDQLAAMAGTIGYEILTSLGPRYTRRHVERAGAQGGAQG
jgi:alanine racemase